MSRERAPQGAPKQAPDTSEEREYQRFREDTEGAADVKGDTPSTSQSKRDSIALEEDAIPIGERETDNYLRHGKDPKFVTDKDERE